MPFPGVGGECASFSNERGIWAEQHSESMTATKKLFLGKSLKICVHPLTNL